MGGFCGDGVDSVQAPLGGRCSAAPCPTMAGVWKGPGPMGAMGRSVLWLGMGSLAPGPCSWTPPALGESPQAGVASGWT